MRKFEADYDDIHVHNSDNVESTFKWRSERGYQLVSALTIPSQGGDYHIVRYLWSREVTND